MEGFRQADVAPPRLPIDTVVVSSVRLYCDCLVEMLAKDPIMRVRAGCSTLEHALDTVATLGPGMVLLDAGFPNGINVAAQLRAFLPAARIVVIAVAETAESVLSWAEAGITGYVPNTTSLSELSKALRQICCGEQFCSSRVAGALLRRVGVTTHGEVDVPDAQASLTHREREILRLVVDAYVATGAPVGSRTLAQRVGLNLSPATIRGVTSQGMILAADDGATVAFLTPERDVAPGAKIK